MYKVYSIISIGIFTLLLGSCAALPIQSKPKFQIKSFVKLEYNGYEKICEPKNPSNLRDECYKFVDGALGSGSIVGNSIDGSYVLTAAHICNKGEEVLVNKFFTPKDGNEHTLLRKFYVYDIDQFKYNAEIIKYDDKNDICLAHVWGLFGPALVLSKDGPEIGDETFNMAAPAGFASEGMVPLFSGVYSGEYKDAAIYTIPAIGGSSGSPIVNIDGHLIGLIYARHIRFHHITLSPQHKVLIKFILDAVKQHTEEQTQKHGLSKERSIIIRFK